jgi:hypothetical protein
MRSYAHADIVLIALEHGFGLDHGQRRLHRLRTRGAPGRVVEAFREPALETLSTNGPRLAMTAYRYVSVGDVIGIMKEFASRS